MPEKTSTIPKVDPQGIGGKDIKSHTAELFKIIEIIIKQINKEVRKLIEDIIKHIIGLINKTISEHAHEINKKPSG